MIGPLVREKNFLKSALYF